MSRFTDALTARVAPRRTRTIGVGPRHGSCPPRVVGTAP